MKHSHCSYCGSLYAIPVWPRVCQSCNETTWRNPLPVVVCLVPVGSGLLLVRRSIPPHIGKLALPGGFLDFGETWRHGAARELREETGVDFNESQIYNVGIESDNEGHLVLFCATPHVEMEAMPQFSANSEVSELVIAPDPIDLAFPTHSKYMRIAFNTIVKK